MTCELFSQEGAVFLSCCCLLSLYSPSALFQNPFTMAFSCCTIVSTLFSSYNRESRSQILARPQFTGRERGLEFVRQIGGIRSHYLYTTSYLSLHEKRMYAACWHMFVVVSFFFFFTSFIPVNLH